MFNIITSIDAKSGKAPMGLLKFWKVLFSQLVILIGCFHAASGQAFEDTPVINIYYSSTALLIDMDNQATYQGQSINQIVSLLNKAKIKHILKPTPWSRLMRQAPLEDNALIFYLTRTEKRESSFHWLAPLSKESLYLFTLNDRNHKYLTKQQIIDGPYNAICLIMSVQCEMLLEFGFQQNRVTMIAEANPGNLTSFILRSRTDFIVEYKSIIQNLLKELQAAPDTLTPLFELSTDFEYLAAPKSIDPFLLEKLRVALADFTLPNNDH